MARPAKSQWAFGELFPPEQPPQVLSVSELTAQIRRLLEKQVGEVRVTGEVTNCRVQSPSGHIYFTLKDAGAQLTCVLFRGEAVVRRDLLQDGRKLLLRGDVTVYEARGQYQLIVRAAELQGTGALQEAFEKLKQQLQAEGLFATERKRPLPAYAQRIGLVTSPTGAAIRDVLHGVRRRNPGLEILLAPCRVQGAGAAGEIAAAIRSLNEWSSRSPECRLDLILITRGGGSLEDLWAFNEEAVARALFESALPVVSAVGHEIDFTIADFAADLRAATPSAAAEIITEGVFSSVQFVARSTARLRQLCAQRRLDKLSRFRNAAERLDRVHPRRRLNEWMQRLDEALADLARNAGLGIRQRNSGLASAAERLARVRPAQWVKGRREAFVRHQQRLIERVRLRLRARRTRFDASGTRLRLLGPEQVLARGYSITTDAQTGEVLRDSNRVRPGQSLKTRLKTGDVFSRAD